jgi:hypothetical protein
VKATKDVVACVYDYGSFICLAEKLSESYAHVYYHSPVDREFRDVTDAVRGLGLPTIERLDDPWDAAVLKTIDLCIFPDIGFDETQAHLRSLGKAVWGSMGASAYELYRTLFLASLKKLGLPVIPSKTVIGLTALAAHLRTVERKWIKINCYRRNMETWFHLDYAHSERQLDVLAVTFGGVRDRVIFVVQDDVPDASEIGYDGWSIDGQFPVSSFQGYEKKNQLYLGRQVPRGTTPEVEAINQALAPTLKQLGYRNFLSTEIRLADGVGYFIDPTFRMPQQTGEQLLETCGNLAEILWAGAHGELVAPQWNARCAASATLHYRGYDAHQWGTMAVPPALRRYVKLYHYCFVDDLYHFPPHPNDEIGVVLGWGDTYARAIAMLIAQYDKLKDEPVSAPIEEFETFLEEVETNEEEAPGGTGAQAQA